MANGELIKQIGDLLEYLYAQNEVALDKASFKEAAHNIYNAIYYGMCNENLDERLIRVKTFFDGDDVDVASFCFYTSKLLMDIGAGELMTYEKEPLSELNDKYKNTINDLEKLVEYQDYIRNLYHEKYPYESERFKGRGVVYSVITGGYDRIYEPETEGSSLDYVLLTDRPYEGYDGKWDVRVVDNTHGYDAKTFSRYLKMNPFEVLSEYDFSVYIDGSIEIRKTIDSLIKNYARKSGMICFPHHNSKNIRQEARLIVDTGKATMADLQQQLDAYLAEGYTGKNCVIEAGCLIREHHDEKLNQVMRDWWEEYLKYPHRRDQMSFGYACWKNGYNYDICDMIVVDNPWLKVKVTH